VLGAWSALDTISTVDGTAKDPPAVREQTELLRSCRVGAAPCLTSLQARLTPRLTPLCARLTPRQTSLLPAGLRSGSRSGLRSGGRARRLGLSSGYH
jgi:hypothetical protein